MRVLRPVVQSFVPPMLDRGHHLTPRSAIAGQLVRDHDTRGPALLLQQLAEQALGGLLVPPALDENVEHNPVLVDSSPQPMLFAGDHQAHLARCHLSPAQGSRRRIWLAKPWPNLRPHWRTVSWLTSMPRAANISSTMRRLSGNRK